MKRTILLLFLLSAVIKTLGQDVCTDAAARYEKSLNPDSGNHLQLNDRVINEFMAGNDAFLQDPQGEYGDWLELYNRTGNTIDLTGMYLTDRPGNTMKWEFPDTSMAPNGYLIIWIDDDEEDTPGPAPRARATRTTGPRPTGRPVIPSTRPRTAAVRRHRGDWRTSSGTLSAERPRRRAARRRQPLPRQAAI